MDTSKLIKIALAVTIAEGWKPPEGADEMIQSSTSYKHHNPGNLRASEYEIAHIDGFSVFHNDITGFYALVRQLELAAKGTGSLYPANITVEEMFSIYTDLEIGSARLDDYLDIIHSVGGVHKTSLARSILTD